MATSAGDEARKRINFIKWRNHGGSMEEIQGFNLEYNDPLFPELVRYFDPTRRKQGGDNPDAFYLGARISGRETYRVHGKRGSARYLVFSTLKPKEGVPGGHALYGSPEVVLQGDDLVLDTDDNFELILSPDSQEGNWIQTTPETSWFTIRQFFGDWLRQLCAERLEPMSISTRIGSTSGYNERLNE